MLELREVEKVLSDELGVLSGQVVIFLSEGLGGLGQFLELVLEVEYRPLSPE